MFSSAVLGSVSGDAMRADSSKPVSLGGYTYLAFPERAEIRSSFGVLLATLVICGAIMLAVGDLGLSMIAAPFARLLGTDIPGLTINSVPASKTDISMLWFGSVVGLIPTGIAALMGWGVVSSLRFRRHPTTFDYTEGVFRRLGYPAISLREIREIRLRRITDPNYPGKAQIVLAVALHDGTTHSLTPRSFQSRFGDTRADAWTNLGEFPDGPKQEAVRGVAAEVAARLGVPLQVIEEQGSLAPSKAMGGM